MMKVSVGCLMLTFLAGCLSVGPGMQDANRRDLTHDGINYSVWFTQEQARIDRVSAGGFAVVRQAKRDMPRVVELATGCKVVANSISGDSNTAKVDLRC